MKPINEKLRDVRKGNKYTQEYIAEYLDTNQAMIWRYEKGITPIPLDKFKKLCQLYGISSDYFLGLPQGLKYPGK